MDYIANTKLFEKMKVVAMGNTNKNLVEITGVVPDICFQIETQTDMHITVLRSP